MSSGTSTVSIITSEILRPNHISHGGTEGLSVASSEAPSAVGAWSSIAQKSYNICASLQALEITQASGRPHSQRGLSPAPPRRKLAPRRWLKKAHLLRWRPRSHAQRTESTPRVRPSGAASHLDLFEPACGVCRLSGRELDDAAGIVDGDAEVMQEVPSEEALRAGVARLRLIRNDAQRADPRPAHFHALQNHDIGR